MAISPDTDPDVIEILVDTLAGTSHQHKPKPTMHSGPMKADTKTGNQIEAPTIRPAIDTLSPAYTANNASQ